MSAVHLSFEQSYSFQVGILSQLQPFVVMFPCPYVG